MSQPSDSFPSDSFPNDPSWSPDQQSIQHQVRHCEPVTRDLNRHLTDLLGRCPVTIDGRWVQLVESRSYADGEVVFPALPVKEALRLATALQTISIEVSLGVILITLIVTIVVSLLSTARDKRKEEEHN